MKRHLGGGRLPDNILRATSSKMAAALKRSNDQVSIYCSYPQSTSVFQAMYSRKTLLYYPAKKELTRCHETNRQGRKQ